MLKDEILKLTSLKTAESFITVVRKAQYPSELDNMVEHIIRTQGVKDMITTTTATIVLLQELQGMMGTKRLSPVIDEVTTLFSMGILLGFKYALFLQEIAELNKMGASPIDEGDLKI